MKPTELPKSGYSITKVYATEQVLRPRQAEDADNIGRASFGWDWRRVPSGEFEVLIDLAVYPTENRPQYVSVSTVGRFRQVGPAPSVPLEDFVTRQAVAILLPYARQFLSNLTANSEAGCYYLPTINVEKLMAGIDTSGATGEQDATSDHSFDGAVEEEPG